MAPLFDFYFVGIGYETSKYIAAHGGRVIIACRSEENATQVSKKARWFGIAQFNLATPGGNTPEIRPLTAHVLPYNFKTKPILNYFKRGARLHPNRFSVRMILRKFSSKF